MKQIHVQLTALWGNDDAESSIRISHRRWSAIQKGEAYEVSASSTYEGKRYQVVWRFVLGRVSIEGDDGMECVVDLPVTDLTTTIVETGRG
jgi:hypothetical protein